MYHYLIPQFGLMQGREELQMMYNKCMDTNLSIEDILARVEKVKQIRIIRDGLNHLGPMALRIDDVNKTCEWIQNVSCQKCERYAGTDMCARTCQHNIHKAIRSRGMEFEMPVKKMDMTEWKAPYHMTSEESVEIWTSGLIDDLKFE